MKMTTQFAIFFIAFNGMAGLMTATGVAADLGINVETGNPQQVTAAGEVDEINISAGSGSPRTLFSLRTGLAQQATAIFNAVLPGMAMLKNFVPDAFVELILTPVAGLVVAKDVIGFLRGTDL